MASAQIDSGGGKSQVGPLTNHASIGASVATGTASVGATSNRSGLIEVLYAAGTPSDPDANANGLPDAWEQQYFGSQGADPSKDPDGDGASNRMEYIAGTDPTSKASVFKPSGSFSNGLYRLPIPTVAGRSYKVYATKDLQSWHLQQTIAGTGESTTFTFDEMTMPTGPLYTAVQSARCFSLVEVDLP